MNKLQLIAKIKKLPPNTPMGIIEGYTPSKGYTTPYDDMSMFSKYSKYINVRNVGEPWSTGGPSQATVQDTKNSWNNKELLKATTEELQELYDSAIRQEAWFKKMSKMSLLEFLFFTNSDSENHE